jgi:hypothetical protein
MSFHRKTLGFAVLLSGAIAFFATPATAAVTFSFSGLEMMDQLGDGIQTMMNGSITIPEFGNTLLGPWEPPTAIDISVYEDGQLLSSFTDPSYLNLKYVDDNAEGILDITVAPRENSQGDFIGLSFYTHFDAVGGVFSTDSLPGAFLSNGSGVPFTVSIPEPSTWAMMLLGFAGLGFAGWRAQRKTAALAA